MANVTEIANISLVELGQEPITEIGEGSDRANVLQSNFAMVRDAVLRVHPWNSACSRKKIAAGQTTPEFEWGFQYPLPTDPYCLRVLAVNNNSAGWKVEGRWILTDMSSPLEVKYIGRPASAEDFDPMLAEVIGLQLAARCAYRLTNSRSKEERAAKKASIALRDARSADGQEGTPDDLAESTILLARD